MLKENGKQRGACYNIMLSLGIAIGKKPLAIVPALLCTMLLSCSARKADPLRFARMFDGQCLTNAIFILKPPFGPSPKPVGKIEQSCGNSIAIDPATGTMAVPSGAVFGKLSVSIYRPPYSSASRSAMRFTPKGLVHPRQSAWDGNGNLWVADDTADKVFEYRAPFSTATQAAAQLEVATQPAGLAIDSKAGLMFVTDLGGDLTCAKAACGVHVIPKPYAGKAIATLTFAREQPFAVAVDRRGRLFVGLDKSADKGEINVYLPPFTSHESPAFSLDASGHARALAFDPEGNLYAQLYETGGVVEFAGPIDGSRSAATLVVGCPQGSFKCARSNWAGLAFGP
ncbi:MAG: hypothetical protein WAK16_12585 [Candidatus Cybelea sp.]